MKKIYIAIFIASVLSAIALWRTDFSLEKIAIPLLETPDLSMKEQFVWPKKFRYLGQGAQMFAFESEDGQYVLKFFNRNYFRTKKKARRQERIRIYPESYRLAFHLSESTGLLAVHQGPSIDSFPTVTLIDKASRTFSVDLNVYPFVLQKKGKGRLFERRKNWIDQFLSFHAKRIRLCIADGDRDIKRNYAWIGDDLLYVDPARFYSEKELENPERRRLEWWKATYRLRKWITKNSPDELSYFEEKLKNLSQ